MNRLREEGALFLLALAFLTRLPVPPVPWTRERAARTPRWYPAVGIVVGAISGAVFAAAALALPPVLAALLGVAAGVLATGALHEDGFADVCDGLGGGQTRERALAIMRDSRIGAFGALGLGLIVAIRVAALASLPPETVPATLVAGHAASRLAPVHLLATGRYLRAEGMAAPVAGRAGHLPLAGTTALLALVPLLSLVPAPAIFTAGMGLLLGYATLRWRIERRLGGYTGDCLGAAQQVAEAGFLLGLLAWL